MLRRHIFRTEKLGHEIISTTILSLPFIQVGEKKPQKTTKQRSLTQAVHHLRTFNRLLCK